MIFNILLMLLNILVVFFWYRIIAKRESNRMDILSGVSCRRCHKGIHDQNEAIQIKMKFFQSKYTERYLSNIEGDLTYCVACKRDIAVEDLESKLPNFIRNLFRIESYQTKNLNKLVKIGTIASVSLLLVSIILAVFGIKIMLFGILTTDMLNLILCGFNILSVLTSYSFTKKKLKTGNE